MIAVAVVLHVLRREVARPIPVAPTGRRPRSCAIARGCGAIRRCRRRSACAAVHVSRYQFAAAGCTDNRWRSVRPEISGCRDRRGQLRIVARPEGPAVAPEVGVGAEHPVAALDAHRRRAVVEAASAKLRIDVVVHRERAARKFELLVQHDARLPRPSCRRRRLPPPPPPPSGAASSPGRSRRRGSAYRPGPQLRQSPLKSASAQSCHVPDVMTSDRARSLKPVPSRLGRTLTSITMLARRSLAHRTAREPPRHSPAGPGPDRRRPADLAHRRHGVAESHRAQRRIFARLQRHAAGRGNRHPRTVASCRRGRSTDDARSLKPRCARFAITIVGREALAAEVFAFETATISCAARRPRQPACAEAASMRQFHRRSVIAARSTARRNRVLPRAESAFATARRRPRRRAASGARAPVLRCGCQPMHGEHARKIR